VAYIRYALPEQTEVGLTIHSTTGALVRTLATGTRKPGYYRAIWNGCDERGRHVAQGIYFLRIESGNATLTRRATKLD